MQPLFDYVRVSSSWVASSRIAAPAASSLLWSPPGSFGLPKRGRRDGEAQQCGAEPPLPQGLAGAFCPTRATPTRARAQPIFLCRLRRRAGLGALSALFGRFGGAGLSIWAGGVYAGPREDVVQPAGQEAVPPPQARCQGAFTVSACAAARAGVSEQRCHIMPVKGPFPGLVLTRCHRCALTGGGELPAPRRWPPAPRRATADAAVQHEAAGGQGLHTSGAEGATPRAAPRGGRGERERGRCRAAWPPHLMLTLAAVRSSDGQDRAQGGARHWHCG